MDMRIKDFKYIGWPFVGECMRFGATSYQIHLSIVPHLSLLIGLEVQRASLLYSQSRLTSRRSSRALPPFVRDLFKRSFSQPSLLDIEIGPPKLGTVWILHFNHTPHAALCDPPSPLLFIFGSSQLYSARPVGANT